MEDRVKRSNMYQFTISEGEERKGEEARFEGTIPDWGKTLSHKSRKPNGFQARQIKINFPSGYLIVNMKNIKVKEVLKEAGEKKTIIFKGTQTYWKLILQHKGSQTAKQYVQNFMRK